MAEKRKIRILLAAAEAVPFAKTGGLGDVAGSLPKALNAAGADCSVILPLYGSIPGQYIDQMVHVADFYVPLAWRNVYCGIEKLNYDGVNFYFVDNEAYFKRDGLYGYFDDGERFAFFSKAICEAIQWLPELQVDILHCNDWQTAMAPVFIREFYQNSDACRHVKTIFTVHNVKFQGQFSDKVLTDILGLADNPTAAGQLYSDRESINYMKGALCYSDLITTVSPSYAGELQMPFYGEGMDDIFRRRSSSLRGILNGIDTKLWNPADDQLIENDYSIDNMAGKAADKAALQRELGLREDPERPLVVMIGRLTNQKGLGLVRYAMNRLMERSVQVAILGTGDKDQEDAFKYFDWTYGDMMAARIQFDNALSHRMYAGGDILLMPSEFEPCGLSQMIAMRYGTLPVVRETGGLQDSVEPYNKYTGEGTGFRFANMNADEMADTLLDACEVFWTDKDAWHRLQRQAMETDFSWKKAAGQYLDAYYDLVPELDRADCQPEQPEPESQPAAPAKPASAPKQEENAKDQPAKVDEAEPVAVAEKPSVKAEPAKAAVESEPVKPETKAQLKPRAEPKPTAEPKPAPKVEAPVAAAPAPKPKAEPKPESEAKAKGASSAPAKAPSEPKAKPATKAKEDKPATKVVSTAKAAEATKAAAPKSAEPETTPSKKPAAKKTSTKKPAAKKSTSSAASSKKTSAATTKKATTSKTTTKKTSTRKTSTSKTASTKASTTKTSKAAEAKPPVAKTATAKAPATKTATSKASTAAKPSKASASTTKKTASRKTSTSKTAESTKGSSSTSSTSKK